MREYTILLVICALISVVLAGCPNGQYCGWCGCDAMYGTGYTCRISSDRTCCWGNNYYDVTTPACGNNRTECEPCDDGNTKAGDGCSGTCTVESGYNCVIDQPTQRSVCTPVCNPGCSNNGTCVAPNVCQCTSGFSGPTCSVALTRGATTCSSGYYCGWCGCDAMYGPGYTCRTSSDHTCCWGNNYYDRIDPAPYCGNNRTECEPCDDGNLVNGDGCTSNCAVEAGYTCTVDQPTQRSVCKPVCSQGCQNGTCVAPNQCQCNAGWSGAACDSNLVRGTTTCTAGQYCGWCGCDAMYGPGYTCRIASDHTCCWGNNYYDRIDPAPLCGNNRTECEPCDDGNTKAGDGCSSTCDVEAGYTCVIDQPTQRSICKPVCSQGCQNGTCVAPNQCQCNVGWSGAACDTNLVRGAFTCSAGQYCGWCGCDAMYGPGYTCRTSSDHSCCWGNNYYDRIDPAPLCGNNRTECEPCDDGNTKNGDGCSSTCTVESGYSCSIDQATQRSICVVTNACLSPTLNNCSPKATCTSQANGAFSCACNTGTFGNGVTCVDNECVTGNNTCAYYQTCLKNSTSGYYCLRKNAWYAIDNKTPGGAGCGPSASDSTWCLQPFDGTRSQYVEFPKYQIPANGFTVEVKLVSNYPSSGQGWTRVFEFGIGPDNNNVFLGLEGLTTNVLYRHFSSDGSVNTISSRVPYTFGTVGRFSLSHSTDETVIVAVNNTNYLLDVLPYPSAVTRTMRYTGRSLYTADSYLFGKVGEIRLWSVARSFSQVRTNTEVHLDPYAATPYTGLVGLYQFDKVCGTTLIDLSGNGNHAVLQNFAAADLFPSCYGRGTCNTATTTCTCNSGFGGYACDKAI